MAGLSEETDLLVVGCGIAGLSAAVSALQSGLSVTLLERAPPEDFGGGTRCGGIGRPTRWSPGQCR